MNSRLPDFFIVGAPKCGTTTLYEWLGGHPRVHAPHKEPCFFSQDIYPTHHLATHIPSLEAYARIFATDRGMLSGEATPKYLYSDQALCAIAALRKDARIIVCLRDPVDLAVSLHNQKLREGVESERDFAAAWLRAMKPGRRTPRSTGPVIDGRINYYFWASIGVRLHKLHQHFARDNIRVVLLSEIASQPRTTYLRLVEFLGLEDDGRREFAATNERVRIRSHRVHQAMVRLKRRAKPFLNSMDRLHLTRGLEALRALNRLNYEPGHYTSQVPDDLRARMYQLLAPDMRLAERFLDGRLLTAVADRRVQDEVT